MKALYLYGIFNLVTSILEVVIALFAYFSPNKTYRKTILALWMTSLAVWSFGVGMHAFSSSESMCLFWSRFLHVGAVFIPVIFLHFIMIITERLNYSILKFLYAASFLMLAFLPSELMIKNLSPIGPFQYFPKAGALYNVYVIEFVACVLISLWFLWKRLLVSSGHEEKQLRFIFVGSLIAYSTGPTAFLYEYDIPIFPFGTPLVLLNSLVIAYAILKYRLMDITVIIRKTIIYTTVMSSLTVIYLGSVSLFAHAFEGLTGYQTIFSSAVAALLITSVFQPLRKKIQSFVDGKFFRQYVDREEKLYELSREVITHTTPEAMGQSLVRVLADTLHPKSAALYLKARDGDGFTLVSLAGPANLPSHVGESNPLSDYFKDHPQPFVQQDLPSETGEPLDTRRPSRKQDAA